MATTTAVADGDLTTGEHTPSPAAPSWEVIGDEIYEAGDFGRSICTVLRGPTFKTNARLIAAAPELLAALQCALFDLEQTYSHVSSVSADRIKSDTIPLCRAAIAKAQGR